MKKATTFLVLFFSLSMFSQSPWTQKKGKTYTQLSFSSISRYDELFGNPDYQTERKITDNTLRFYAAYGLSDKTTFFIGIPFKTVKSEELVNQTPTPITSKGSLSSAGNFSFGVKHNFYNKKWLITGQVNIETNTQTYNAISGLRTGYDAWTISSLAIIGRGFNLWHIQAYTGLDYRTNQYSTNFRLGGEMGYKIAKWFTFIGFADGVASLGNGDVVLPQENRLTGLFVDKQSFAAFGLKTIFDVDKNFGVNLGIGFAFGGRNVPRKAVVSGGIYYKFF